MRLSIASLFGGGDRGWKSMYSVCGLTSCPNKSMGGAESRGGVAVGEVWYCGMTCFAKAARNKFSGFLSANAEDMTHVPRRSIGLLLLSKGILTREQLQTAFQESLELGDSLETALLRLGLVSDRQLAMARAAQWGCPVLGHDGIGKTVEADIPPTLLDTYAAVPLHSSLTAKRLVIGFVYRIEHSLMSSLEQMTGLRAEPCFITPAEHTEQMRHLAHDAECEEIVFDDPYYSPSQMANNVAGFALEITAREARFVHCRDFIWARLKGRRKKIDVLFRVNRAKQAQWAEGARRTRKLLASG
jgi:Type II secretion system (T2SS), protein E, N-terminal domain